MCLSLTSSQFSPCQGRVHWLASSFTRTCPQALRPGGADATHRAYLRLRSCGSSHTLTTGQNSWRLARRGRCRECGLPLQVGLGLVLAHLLARIPGHQVQDHSLRAIQEPRELWREARSSESNATAVTVAPRPAEEEKDEVGMPACTLELHEHRPTAHYLTDLIGFHERNDTVYRFSWGC